MKADITIRNASVVDHMGELHGGIAVRAEKKKE